MLILFSGTIQKFSEDFPSWYIREDRGSNLNKIFGRGQVSPAPHNQSHDTGHTYHLIGNAHQLCRGGGPHKYFIGGSAKTHQPLGGDSYEGGYGSIVAKEGL